jgi:hypothetical protein
MLICHCEAGVSRSAAIAAAGSKYFNGDDSFFFEHYYPNEYVYNMMTNNVLTEIQPAN